MVNDKASGTQKWTNKVEYVHRHDTNIYEKMEGLLKILLEKCCDKLLKKKHPPITKSIFEIQEKVAKKEFNEHYKHFKKSQREYKLLRSPFNLEKEP